MKIKGVFFAGCLAVSIAACEDKPLTTFDTESYEASMTCPNCSGSGSYGYNTCVACQGTGLIIMDEDVITTTTTNGGQVTFRGKTTVKYGPCNNRCGCQAYVHAPGQTECSSCKYYTCSSNKFGHSKINQ